MANIAPNITSVGISCEPPPPTPPGEGAIAHATSGKKRLIGPSGYPIVREKPSPERVERAAADRLAHRRLGLADGQAADGVAVEAEGHRALDGLRSEVVERSTLDDAEQRLAAGAGRVSGARALGPAQRQRERALGGLARGRIGQALVERHRDVGAERPLDLDDRLRRQKARGPVERRAELDAVVAALAELGQAEDLEDAGVGEDRAVPAHEAVQAAEVAHDVRTRAEQQVVGVTEDDLRAGGLEVFGRERLDRRLGANGHEDRRVHHAVRGGEPAAARGAVGREDLEFERRHSISMASPYEASEGSSAPLPNLPPSVAPAKPALERTRDLIR